MPEKENGVVRSIISSLAEKIGRVPLMGYLQQNDMSDRDIRRDLSNALESASGGQFWFFVRDVYDDHFVYEREEVTPDGPGEIKMYKRGYSVNDEEKIELNDEAVQVKERITYVNVNEEDSNTITVHVSNQGKGLEKEVLESMQLKIQEAVDEYLSKKINKEESEMKREEMVSQLIDNGHFEEESRDWLTELSDCQFTKIQQLAEKQEKELPEADLETNEDEEETTETKHKSLDELLGEADPKIREFVKNAVEQQEQLRDELVKEIMECKVNDFPEDKLKSMEIKDLKSLAKFTKLSEGVDFSGKGGNSSSVTQNKEMAPAPRSLFQKEEK